VLRGARQTVAQALHASVQWPALLAVDDGEAAACEHSGSEDHSIGGQAVLEGVMMRGRGCWGLAVRRPSGGIAERSFLLEDRGARYPVLKWPIVRGIVGLWDSLSLGIKALGMSANLSLEEGEPAEGSLGSTEVGGAPAPPPLDTTAVASDGAGGSTVAADGAGSPVDDGLPREHAVAAEAAPSSGAVSPAEAALAAEVLPSGEAALAAEAPPQLGFKELAVTVGVAVIFAVVLFVVIPLAIVKFFEETFSNPFVFNLVEGLIRIVIFILYIVAISFIPDLKRVFQYHGAEHKAINTYEAGEPLDTDHTRHFSTIHPRCGTAFLLVVMVMAVLIFALVGKPALHWLVLSRLVGIPVVIGLAYEVIRFAGRHRGGIVARFVLWPGLALQRLTTREPSDDQVQVAIAVLHEVLRVEAGGAPLGVAAAQPASPA